MNMLSCLSERHINFCFMYVRRWHPGLLPGKSLGSWYSLGAYCTTYDAYTLLQYGADCVVWRRWTWSRVFLTPRRTALSKSTTRTRKATGNLSSACFWLINTSSKLHLSERTLQWAIQSFTAATHVTTLWNDCQLLKLIQNLHQHLQGNYKWEYLESYKLRYPAKNKWRTYISYTL
jgi:hypothetical protein